MATKKNFGKTTTNNPALAFLGDLKAEGESTEIKKYTSDIDYEKKIQELEQKDFKLSEDKFAQGVIAKLDLNQMEENLLTVNKLVYSTEFDCMVDYISFYKAVAAQKI